jgi:hypothetical protein
MYLTDEALKNFRRIDVGSADDSRPCLSEATGIMELADEVLEGDVHAIKLCNSISAERRPRMRSYLSRPTFLPLMHHIFCGSARLRFVANEPGADQCDQTEDGHEPRHCAQAQQPDRAGPRLRQVMRPD